eukprot:scaffold168633_cov39-Cyclotella_meneghiniana.AAC.3
MRNTKADNAAKRSQLSFKNGDARRIREIFRRWRRIREQSMKESKWLTNVMLMITRSKWLENVETA